MDQRTFNIITRLPDYVVNSLQANRSNGQMLNSLLETYKQNGLISENEAAILYDEYMASVENVQAENYGFNSEPVVEEFFPQSGAENQPPQEDPEKKAKAVELAKIIVEKKKIYPWLVIMAVTFVFVGFIFFMSGFPSEDITEPANLADSIDFVTENQDFYLEDIEIFTNYADYEESGDHNERVKFYLALVPDREGSYHIVSVSFDDDSDVYNMLSTYGFDDAYIMSGYFRTDSLTDTQSDDGTTAKKLFDETIDEVASVTGSQRDDFNIVEMDFRYAYPDGTDYVAEKENENRNMKIFGGIILVLGAGLIYLCVSNKKKRKQAVEELHKMGYK